MGKDKGRSAAERYIERKQQEVDRSYWGSAKEESDRRAARGEGWHGPLD